MNYFADEKLLIEADNKVLVLTTHRLRYDSLDGGLAVRKELVSILLEELVSCAITRISYPLLLLLALGGVMLALLMEGAAIVGIALAVLFTGGFFASQRRVLLISSAGSKIQVNIAHMSLQSLREFVDEIEDAKNRRYMA